MVAWKNLTMENITDGKTLETKISRLKKHEQNLSFVVALGNVNEKKTFKPIASNVNTKMNFEDRRQEKHGCFSSWI